MDNGIDSYLRVPFLDGDGDFLGHLAVFDERRLPAEPRRLFIMRIFAARTTAELERLRAEKRLRQSEQRYRDLYEEAPLGYVSVGTDGRIRSVNRRATQWIGYAADELVGSPILDICADGPTGRMRAAEAFQSFLAGVETCGQEIELRRKDGRPLWISLWSKPLRGEDGAIQVSRSIWVDITDRVQAEAERTRLRQQNLYLQEQIRAEYNIEEVVGRSAALRAVLDSIHRVAPTDASVLICGETGTGKELIARAVHSASKRRDKSFIKINCAALPTGLVESELFGHEKGAFTGANSRRIGRFELAHDGTIFLDEIGDIPAETQAKLLRVLQEHEFDRVGGSAPIRVDVRVVAASNRDLLKAVREQTFREDLYYRLSVFPVHLPPLRERTDDIPLLVQFLIDKFSHRIGKRIDGVSPRTMQRLLVYPWPGNVRELENVLERAVILAADTILDFDLDVPCAAPTAPVAGGPRSLERVERDHILSVLQQTDWIIEGHGGAAGILGVPPSTLRHRMKKLGLHRVPQRASHQISR